MQIDLTEVNEKERQLFEGQKPPRKVGRKRKEAEPLPPIEPVPPLLAKQICIPFNLILAGLKSPPMSSEMEVDYATAWWGLLNKRIPGLFENWKEELLVGYLTLTIFAPAVAIYIQRRAEEKEPEPTNGQPRTD